MTADELLEETTSLQWVLMRIMFYWRDGKLSEGQVAALTGLNRIEARRLAEMLRVDVMGGADDPDQPTP